MLHINSRGLYEPVGETGASGAVGGTTEPASASNPFAGVTQETTSEVTATPAVTTPETKPVVTAPTTAVTEPAKQLSAAEIADIAAQAAIRATPQQAQTQQTAQPKVSQEEFDKTFNVVKVTPEMFTAITGYAPEKPEQVAALQSFTQAIVKQATSMATYMAQQYVDQLKTEFGGQLAPITQAHQQSTAENVKSDFFKAHPDLKELEPLVMEVAENLRLSGKKMSKDEAFKFVADRTRSLLPKGVATSPGNTSQQTQQQTVQRTMTALSGAGQSSSGNGSATPPGNDNPKAIFG